MIKSIPLNTVFHSPKHRVADNAKRLITLTNLSHFKQVVGALHPTKGLPTALVDQYSIDMNVSSDCVAACLEWVCRVNRLDNAQLRILALTNIMSGRLYEEDLLTNTHLDEIEQLHNDPHAIDLTAIEKAMNIHRTTIWDRPTVSWCEIEAMGQYAPTLTKTFYRLINGKAFIKESFCI